MSVYNKEKTRCQFREQLSFLKILSKVKIYVISISIKMARQNFETCEGIAAHFRSLFEHNNETQSTDNEDEHRSTSDMDQLEGGAADEDTLESLSGAEADNETDEENAENYYDEISDLQDKRTSNPFEEGTTVYSDQKFDIIVKSVSHKKNNRYKINDHLYRISFHRKTPDKLKLLNLESAIEVALIKIIDKLKRVYRKDNQHQIYVTVIEKRIKNGLNSGNYSLNTPSRVIARWVLSMLYNFLKSKQSMKLTKSFNVMIKVLSVRHIRDLVKNKSKNKKFRPHVYH